MRRAFHDGLRARQFQLRIKAVDHRVIAVAMNQITEIGEVQVLVEFGIAAARHVEIEPLVACRDDIDLQTAAAGPDFVG